jgi:hypothetical protein
MKRYRQTLDELLRQLAPVGTSWRDAHAEAVIRRLKQLPKKKIYTRADLTALFDIATLPRGTAKKHFEASLTIVRLFLDMSKDEFTAALRERLDATPGITHFKQHPDGFFEGLESLGVLDRMGAIANAPVAWFDVLIERLKGGRGSAIKGQRRGRVLEDFVEQLVIRIFGKGRYNVRCRFVGKTGVSTEKADFAIPSKDDPSILIEAKAYGATGSKQTDVLGDVSRIGAEKRDDTNFLFVTDGLTWRDRVNDLRKLVRLQNQGRITRIYTQSMAAQLESDLRQLKLEHGL